MGIEFILDTGIGFLLGFVSSWLFWRYQNYLKPRVRLSKYVAKAMNRDNPEHFVYRFKVFNFGKRPAINVSLSGTVCKLRIVPGGQISKGVKKLPFSRETVKALGPRKNLGDPWGVSPVQVFVCRPDFELEQLMESEDAKLLLTLAATDALSGATLVERIPFDRHQIIMGTHAYGEDMSVIGV
jgi:hypothetical protein